MSETHSPETWQSRAKAAVWDTRPFINGRRASVTGAAAVSSAVEAARNSFLDERWSGLPPAARREVLLSLAARIDANAEELGLGDSLDMGKPISAAIIEAHIAAHFVRWFAEAADKLHDGSTVPGGRECFELHLRRPRGVVAAITPWNYPVINAPLKFAPALAVGNSVVLKPSELSLRSASRLVELALEAGVPEGVLNFLPGDGATGDLLARHTDVDMVAFTGSTATGRALMRSVGDSSLKPLQLECGGKSPEIVFADAGTMGVDAIASSILAGSLANQGQLCVARTRILVHRSLYDALLESMVESCRRIEPGDSLDPATRFGPLASAAQFNKVNRYIEEGISAGARLVLDGRRDGMGYGSAPTIFDRVPLASSIAREEIFGPVLCIFGFDEDDEALALANDGHYGLAATVWTRDLERAHLFTSRLRAGKVKIMGSPHPTMGVGVAHESEPNGQSGFGVEGGLAGLHTYTRLQAVEFSFGRPRQPRS
ncbi:MAG: aldehyde dehydrogenase family protein [Steroidobacteraceae bacterium]